MLPKEENLYLIFTIVLSITYFLFSKTSDGFYQHDEAGHFISMRTFWYDHTSALGNWSKPGFKLIYVVPALLGEQFVIYFNCLIAAFTSFFVYKLAKQLKSQYAGLAFFLLATQPLWILLSSRNYAELISAFLIVAGIYLHYKKKYYWTALIASYLCLIRQEFYLLYGLYGLYLLFNKRFLPAIVSTIPQIFVSLWAYIANGDILYIYNSVFDFSEKTDDAYPRQGFSHYFRMASVIFGSVNLTLFFAYLSVNLVRLKKVNLFVLSTAVIFFLLHSLFNSTTLEFGPASGGNLRYMVVIAPLIALMAALSLDDFMKLNKKQRIAWSFMLAGFVAAIGVFQTYAHNNIVFLDKRSWEMLYFAIPTALILMIPYKKVNPTILSIILISLSFILSAYTIKPYERSPEDNTMKSVTDWYQHQVKMGTRGRSDNILFDEDTQVLSVHPLFFYYQGKTMYNFSKPVLPINKESVDTTEIGSLIIWDSHYSYRPKLHDDDLPVGFFLDRPYNFQLIKQLQSVDKNFSAYGFLKLTQLDTIFEQGIDSLVKQNWAYAKGLFEQVYKKAPNNFVAINYMGICNENLKKPNEAYQQYTKALEIFNQYHQGYYQRANLFLKYKKTDEALKDINEAISLYPQNFQYYFLRGGVYFAREDYKESIKNYTQAIQLNPQLSGAFYNVAMCQIRMDEKKSAKENLLKAKALGSEEADAALATHFPEYSTEKKE